MIFVQQCFHGFGVDDGFEGLFLFNNFFRRFDVQKARNFLCFAIDAVFTKLEILSLAST